MVLRTRGLRQDQVSQSAAAPEKGDYHLVMTWSSFIIQVTRLILTIITVYLLCWLPHWAVQLLLMFSPGDM